MPNAAESRLSSFENPNGIKGQGGKTNKMAKGNAFEFIKPGETKTLLDIKGQGSIQRIWLTIDQTPVKLRSLRLQFFWDGQSKPAVDVPMGDFFGYNLGKKVAFQSAFFCPTVRSSPLPLPRVSPWSTFSPSSCWYARVFSRPTCARRLCRPAGASASFSCLISLPVAALRPFPCQFSFSWPCSSSSHARWGQ